MFLLNFHFKHTRLNGSGEINFYADANSIKKWTFLSGGKEQEELLKLIAVSCIGYKFMPCLEKYLQPFCDSSGKPVALEACQARHAPRDCSMGTFPFYTSGLKILPRGKVVKFKTDEYKYGSPLFKKRHPSLGSGIRKNLVIAHGSDWKHHKGTDCFDFSQPDFRAVRFLPLFTDNALQTDPIAFLQKLHYKAIKGRKPAINTLESLAEFFNKYFSINTSQWNTRNVDFNKQWVQLHNQQKIMLVPILDIVRHVIDASPHDFDPLSRHGIVLSAFPEKICADDNDAFTNWITALHGLLPNIQFIMSISRPESLDNIPEKIRISTLNLPQQTEKPESTAIQRFGNLGKNDVVLIDIDSRIPNLALMKLSRSFKQQGRNVILVRHEKWQIKNAEEVYASCVFNFTTSQKRVEKLRKKFGSRVQFGGSGVDIKLRLPDAVEQLPPDFDLYPELSDRAIGFITRGCTRKCDFCIVPEKEGLVKQVASLDEARQKRDKLILLDDNILAHPDADKLLEEIYTKNIRVNFNQTLDILFVDRNRAELLKKIKCSNIKFTRTNYYFSLNDSNNLDQVKQRYDLFNFCGKDNVQFVCMYGYKTTLEEDIARFRFLRSLPGAYVFVQQYKPVLGRKFSGNPSFFNGRTDQLIDQLIKIIFTQNMQSMENYYRWLSKLYYEAFGTFHEGLVDTIFRYNQRDRKYQYMENIRRIHKKHESNR